MRRNRSHGKRKSGRESLGWFKWLWPFLSVAFLLYSVGVGWCNPKWLVQTGSVWRYLDTGANLGTNWIAVDFNDGAWISGNAQLGYGDGDEATKVGYGPNSNNVYITTYFRRTFVVDNPWEFSNAAVRLLRDDGAVVYLNSREIFRSNIPTGAVSFLTVASEGVGGAAESNYFYQALVPPEYLRSGSNVLAVEVHQSAPDSSDLSFDLELIGNYLDGIFTKSALGGGDGVPGYFRSVSAADYNNDGWMDLFMANHSFMPPLFLRNVGDASFSRVTSGNIGADDGDSYGAAWGDYNNDGNADLFVANWSTQSDFLYRNNGGGSFSKITGGPLTNPDPSQGASWVDYDNDGWLDLFVANTTTTNVLYKNTGNGNFARATNSISQDGGDAPGHAWGDYNNDGLPDLVLANRMKNNMLYKNMGGGVFTRMPSSVIASDGGDSSAAAWGDYDNDGYADLFIVTAHGRNNLLYRNNGGNSFTKVFNQEIANDAGSGDSCAWGDYDNDGFLDMFVANGSGEDNFLYHNNGNGTFSRVWTSIAGVDGGNSAACNWVDLDKDGFLDLVVANSSLEMVYLYRNNGNSNHWLNVTCRGTLSNRSAIGAKVRVKSDIAGTNQWQLREISGGDGYGSPNMLQAHFGLGGSTKVEEIRIEWPSKLVTVLTNVAADQYVSVVEPLGGVQVYANGIVLTGGGSTNTNSVEVSFSTTFANGFIVYSIKDGVRPALTNVGYWGPFVLTNSATIRARAYTHDGSTYVDSDPVLFTVRQTYSVNVFTSGGGMIAVEPPQSTLVENTLARLTATPLPGWNFLYWLGDVTGTNPMVFAVINGDKCMEAVFGTDILLSRVGAGTIATEPALAWHAFNAGVQLTAIPEAGNGFVRWGEGVDSSDNPIQLRITNATPMISATFQPLEAGQVTLVVTSSGYGRVALSPRANVYTNGQVVILRAEPEPQQTFLGWNGDASGTEPVFSVVLTGSKRVAADFSKKPRLAVRECGGKTIRGTVQLIASGEPGERLQLQTSTDLTNWTLFRDTTNVFGIQQFNVPYSGSLPRQFYRVVNP